MCLDLLALTAVTDALFELLYAAATVLYGESVAWGCSSSAYPPSWDGYSYDPVPLFPKGSPYAVAQGAT